MKKSILILFVLLSQVCIGQTLGSVSSFIESTYKEDKKCYSYIVVYRTWDQHLKQTGDFVSPVNSWTTRVVGFGSLDDLLNWLNPVSPYDNRPRVSLTENNLIAIYDLTTAEKIEYKLKTENKSLPHRVEIEEEKWTETYYEITAK